MIPFNYQNALYAWMNLKTTNRFIKYRNASITSTLNAVQNGFLAKIKEKKKDALYVIQFSKLMRLNLEKKCKYFVNKMYRQIYFSKDLISNLFKIIFTFVF